MAQSGHGELHLPISGVVLAATMLLASLGLGARLLLRWDKTDRQQLSAWRLRRGPNEENVLIMISPAFACDQNVYDFDPLNFKLV
jgi:hypothetical protein